MLDSGFETEAVYSFCRAHSSKEFPILPCKGTALTIGGKPYDKRRLGENGTRKMRRAALTAIGQVLVMVPNDYWQPVLQRCFDEIKPGDPESLTLCVEARDDLDMAEQLLNEVRKPAIDSSGHRKMIWKIKDEDAPNDFRDALKYCRCAADVFKNQRWGDVPLLIPRAGLPPTATPEPTPDQQRERAQRGGFVRRRTGGQPFVRRRR
jgi:hypothetical protein